MLTPAPFLLQPMLYEKVWGGRALASLGKPLPPAALIGESWELADMPITSASGAGGKPARSVIRSGPLAGKTLGDAVATWGTELLGPAQLSADGGFPLLVKFLDANENLSVQVHPSPAYAAAHPEAKLKTECWYIIDAKPGAVIYKGIKHGVTRDRFARAIADNTVADLMIAEPAIPGECHNLPSGTCHALGAGVLVAEVQTPSDTTFRVYDWGRTGRELHIEQALACIDFGPAPRATMLKQGEPCTRLVTTEFFTLDQAKPSMSSTDGKPQAMRIGYDNRAFALILLDGTGTLRSTTSAFPDLPLTRGDTALLPAATATQTDFIPTSPTTSLLRACVL